MPKHSGAQHPDLYIGNDPHHHVPPIDQRGETNVFDGRNGTLLKNLPLPAPYDSELGSPGNLGPNLGWTVSAPGDLNGDGEPDYVAEHRSQTSAPTRTREL